MQGVQFDGAYSPKYLQLIDNIYAEKYIVTYDTLVSDGGLTVYVTPGFELEYEYKNVTYNHNSNLINHEGWDENIKEFGSLVSIGSYEGTFYQNRGSNTANGYFTKITGYSYETNIDSEVIGIIDASGFGSSVYQNYLHLTSGDDIFHGTSKGDILNAGTGNDDIYGGSGDDFLIGFSGDDFFTGGSGDDFLEGGEW